jgi:hypothetical protein
MRIAGAVVILAGAFLPALTSAQSSTPVSDDFRLFLAFAEKNLVASAKEMPAEKYGYKPTAPQMAFGEVVLHVAADNDAVCAPIGDVRAPDRLKLTPTDGKDKLIERLRESFALCDQVAAHLDDSNLGGVVSFFGRQGTRAAAIGERIDDWADHYSQMSIYLRLNGLLPPTAQRS